jgi:hypothetical protein
MSRAISIAGVRTLVSLARACARAPSEVAWHGRAQRNCSARALRGWRHARARHGAGHGSAR